MEEVLWGRERLDIMSRRGGSIVLSILEKKLLNKCICDIILNIRMLERRTIQDEEIWWNYDNVHVHIVVNRMYEKCRR